MKPYFMLVLVVFINCTSGYSDCAYLHPDKNILYTGDNLNGVLYTNGCRDIFPQVKIVLLDQENEQVSQRWILLESSMQPFTIEIPKNIEEGLYQLVVFTTRSMKIVHSQTFPIFRIDGDQTMLSEQETVEGDSEPMISVNRGLSVNWSRSSNEENRSLMLEIETDSMLNDAANVSIKISDKAQSIPDSIPSISKSASGTGESRPFSSFTFALEGYLSDTAGTSCKFCPVLLTLPSLEEGIYYTKTDATGSFAFTGLQHFGNLKGYLSYSADSLLSGQQFFIHQRKAVLNVPLPRRSFEQTKAMLMPKVNRHLITRVFRNAENTRDTVTSEQATRPYQEMMIYPKFDMRISFDEYHLADDMKGIIKSIIPNVNTIRKNQIRVFSIENRRNFPESPLILLDGIPINSVIALSLDPRTIHKAEVIYKQRSLIQIGNVASNGVLSLFSKNGTDETRLPGVQKVYVKGFDNDKSQNSEVRASHLFSSLLYWNPSITLQPNEVRKILVPLPNHFLELNVSIVGHDSNGNMLYYQGEISK